MKVIGYHELMLKIFEFKKIINIFDINRGPFQDKQLVFIECEGIIDPVTREKRFQPTEKYVLSQGNYYVGQTLRALPQDAVQINDISELFPKKPLKAKKNPS
jgi:hypothetical protein